MKGIRIYKPQGEGEQPHQLWEKKAQAFGEIWKTYAGFAHLEEDSVFFSVVGGIMALKMLMPNPHRTCECVATFWPKGLLQL